MTLESGPAKADRNWQLIRTVIFLGFGLYFLYDGLYGYPQENRKKAEALLATRPFSGKVQYDALGDAPDEPDWKRLQKTAPAPAAAVRAKARELLGAPALTDGGDDYFISRYGYIKLPSAGEATWHPWAKTHAEIVQQYACALIAAIPGLYFLWRTYKAATLRVVVDDQGLVFAGRRIACADMTSLRGYSPKGWIDLYYRSGPGERKLRLDNEKVARFAEVVEAICQAKGFRNEVKAYAERKAQQAAEEARAAEAEVAITEAEQPKDEK